MNAHRKLQTILWSQHQKEARRMCAEIYNLGWGQTDTAIASKTSKGVLETEIDPKTMAVTHTWEK